MTDHSGIREFSVEAEDRESYIEQLENHIMGHDIIQATKKWATLLNECGAPTYSLQSLVAQNKLNEAEYKVLVKKIQEHFVPKPSVILQCVLSFIPG